MLCSPPESTPDINVRVFLAAYMIVYRPHNVFESTGELETALMNSATQLLARFQQICEVIRTQQYFVSSELTDGFPALLQDYMERFQAWKVPDQERLAIRLKSALFAMYQALTHTPNGDTRTEINTQIERLRRKLAQIKGEEELLQFDVDRLSGVQFPPYINQRFSGLANEQLSHELMLNREYQLKDNSEAGFPELWSNMEAELRCEPPCYTLVLRTLEEIRGAIISVSDESTINGVMDFGFIQTQPQWGECVRFVEAVVGVIQHFQTPERDEKTKTEWEDSILPTLRDATLEQQPLAFSQTLKFLLTWVNGMRIDTANQRIRLIVDIVREHGIEYARNTFQAKLDNGRIGLEHTEVCFFCFLSTQQNLTPPTRHGSGRASSTRS